MQWCVSVLTQVLKLFFQSHAVMRKTLLADQCVSIGKKVEWTERDCLIQELWDVHCTLRFWHGYRAKLLLPLLPDPGERLQVGMGRPGVTMTEHHTLVENLQTAKWECGFGSKLQAISRRDLTSKKGSSPVLWSVSYQVLNDSIHSSPVFWQNGSC